MARQLRLIATDLDGTLLAPSGRLSPGAAQAAQAAIERGIAFVLATGRPIGAVAGVARELRSDPAGLPVVCFNGAVAAVLGSDGLPARILHTQRLHPGLPAQVLRFAADAGYPVQWCDLDATYSNASSPAQEQLLLSIEAIDGLRSQTADLSQKAAAGAAPLKIVLATGDPQSAEAVAEMARACIDRTLCHIVAAEVHVEFLPAGCDKRAGLDAVMSELGIDWSEVVFFGDGNNDVEALQAAGVGLAMPNGTEAAKDAADEVVRMSNAEGGVAKEIMARLRVL